MSKTKAAPQQEQKAMTPEELEQRVKLARELAVRLQERIFNELGKLDLQDEVWQLIHSADLLNYFQSNPGELENRDFSLFVEDALNALVKTGGL